ncbi:hypothetical protein [Salinispora arenicola]|uniref:hypothetical protein n=1 Tax=Salinispora arenicola TaxID=168697 RepID=UPI0027DC916E|nr:hypothetical protein [Salinispora arenicola]
MAGWLMPPLAVGVAPAFWLDIADLPDGHALIWQGARWRLIHVGMHLHHPPRASSWTGATATRAKPTSP